MTPIGELIKKFPNTYEFCNNDINKFILLAKKGAYAYEYMDSWERFDKTSLPAKETFYSKLYLDDITDEDYVHAQKVFEEVIIKNLVNIMIYMFQLIRFYLQMYLKTLEINVLKYMNLMLLIFYLYLD